MSYTYHYHCYNSINGLILNEEDEFFQELAAMVKQHRKGAGLSQIELADFAGVGKTVVYDIEHAKKTVKMQTLYKVLNALNITIVLKSPL